MKLCRKQRIDTIKIDNLEFRLELPPEAEKPQRQPKAFTGMVTEDTPITTDALTEEQMLMWSSAPGGQ